MESALDWVPPPVFVDSLKSIELKDWSYQVLRPLFLAAPAVLRHGTPYIYACR